jgi:hypothetical protein
VSALFLSAHCEGATQASGHEVGGPRGAWLVANQILLVGFHGGGGKLWTPLVISKFLHCTILENFNLKWTRIQRGVDLGCCWMLFFLLRRVR